MIPDDDSGPEVQEEVAVTIEYYGRFRELVGSKQEIIHVSPVLATAHTQVCAHVKEHHGIMPPYILMVRNLNIIGALKVNSNQSLTDEDVFKFLPTISGG
jgi:molybdopterin converting factor small subunit